MKHRYAFLTAWRAEAKLNDGTHGSAGFLVVNIVSCHTNH